MSQPDTISNSSMEPWDGSVLSFRYAYSAYQGEVSSGFNGHQPYIINSPHRLHELSDMAPATYYLPPLSMQTPSTTQHLNLCGLAFESDPQEVLQSAPPYRIELEIYEDEEIRGSPMDHPHNNQQTLLSECQQVGTSNQTVRPAGEAKPPVMGPAVLHPRGSVEHLHGICPYRTVIDECSRLGLIRFSNPCGFDTQPYYTHSPLPPRQDSAPCDQKHPCYCPPNTFLSAATKAWLGNASSEERLRLGLPRWENDDQRLRYYRQTRPSLPQAATMSFVYDDRCW